MTTIFLFLANSISKGVDAPRKLWTRILSILGIACSCRWTDKSQLDPKSPVFSGGASCRDLGGDSFAPCGIDETRFNKPIRYLFG
jgi:hypothetical protein